MACTLQLLDGTGTFNVTGLEDFVHRVELKKCGVSFKVVGIMGAQSSGKSTLMNELFGTKFGVMDASKGRRQTTQGVWVAKSVKVTPCTLVMDLEGSDGAERGEDDTLFEKQIALLALAVTDVLLINIWYTDIGRENAAGRPLLRVIFDMMRRMFGARKMTLMFVIRDMSRQASIKILESDLLNDLQKIWDEASDSGKHQRSEVREFFHVIVTSLPNYEERPEEFAEQVTKLRMRFENPMERGGLAAGYSRTVPGTVFSHSTQEQWRSIQENKVLDIPGHRHLVSAYRCDQIAKQKLTDLQSDMMSLPKEGDANSTMIEGCGKVVGAMVTKCLDGYWAETEYMDEHCRKTKLNDLRREVSNMVWPVCIRQIELHQGQAFSEYKSNYERMIRDGAKMKEFLPNAQEAALDSFDRGCEDAKVADLRWTTSQDNEIKELREELSKEIGTHVKQSQEAKVKDSMSSSQERLRDSLIPRLTLLDEAGKSKTCPGIWSEFFNGSYVPEVKRAQSELAKEIRMHLDLPDKEMLELCERLELHGRSTVEKVVKAKKPRMGEQILRVFREKFSRDESGGSRQWTATTDIAAIASDAESRVVQQLATFSAIRLVEGNNDGIDVESLNTLVIRPESVLGKTKRIFTRSETPEAQRDKALAELSSKSQWRNVSESDTVITPLEFKRTWLTFEEQVRGDIDKAMEEKDKSIKKWVTGIAVGAVATPLVATAVAI